MDWLWRWSPSFRNDRTKAREENKFSDLSGEKDNDSRV